MIRYPYKVISANPIVPPAPILVTKGFFCQAGIQLGEIRLSLLELVACESAAIGVGNQMIVGRDILNRICVKFDGQRQVFSFEED